MGESHAYARDAYLGTIGIHIGCTSALPRENLSTCRSDTPILGSGHVRFHEAPGSNPGVGSPNSALKRRRSWVWFPDWSTPPEGRRLKNLAEILEVLSSL